MKITASRKMAFVKKEIETLQQLTSVRINDPLQALAIDQSRDVLRKFYETTARHWKPKDIQTIKNCLEVEIEKLPTVILEDGRFILGHFYFYSGGVFRVTKNNPGIEFEVGESKIYESADSKSNLWKTHSHVLEDRLKSIQRLTHEKHTAEDIIRRIKQDIVNEITEKHSRFRTAKGLPPASLRSGTGKHRITHCYSCKVDLDSEVELECSACDWIVCSCGACGCGYKDKSKKRLF